MSSLLITWAANAELCGFKFINPPHPFSIVLNRFWYFIKDLLRTIEPLENNRKWVWYVYKQVLYLKFKTSRYAPGLEFQYKTSHSVIILYITNGMIAGISLVDSEANLYDVRSPENNSHIICTSPHPFPHHFSVFC